MLDVVLWINDGKWTKEKSALFECPLLAQSRHKVACYFWRLPP
jgi:hypothetical protein